MAIDPRLTRTPPSAPRARTAPVETPPSSTSAPQTSAAPRAQSDAERKKLAQPTDRAPVKTGTASTNARAALLSQVQKAREDGRFTTEQRKVLRTAWKQLDDGAAGLEDHLAMRALAAEAGVRGAFDEILRAHAERLLPELLEKANVFAGTAGLRALGEVADAMDQRAAFDVHVAEQLAVARAWAKSDGDRAEVEGMARALGLSIVPADAPSAPSAPAKKDVVEELEAVRKSRALVSKNPRAWAGYRKVLDLLARGEAGHNQHPLSHDLAGLWAADLPGSGAGRGAMRILYERDGDRVVVKDLVDYH